MGTRAVQAAAGGRRQDRRARWAGLRADFAYGLRAVLRAPLFASLAVLTLALGIGANAPCSAC